MKYQFYCISVAKIEIRFHPDLSENNLQLRPTQPVSPRKPLHDGDNMYWPLLSPLGRDDGGRTHTDGRGVWWRGRAADHATGERPVRWDKRPGRWGQFQQLACTGGTLALEQQALLQSGEQEWQLPVISIDHKGPNWLLFQRLKAFCDTREDGLKHFCFIFLTCCSTCFLQRDSSWWTDKLCAVT